MKKFKSRFTNLTSTLLLAISAIPLASCGIFEETESVSAYKRSYSFNEIKTAEKNTFKKLNDVKAAKIVFVRSFRLGGAEEVLGFGYHFRELSIGVRFLAGQLEESLEIALGLLIVF